MLFSLCYINPKFEHVVCDQVRIYVMYLIFFVVHLSFFVYAFFLYKFLLPDNLNILYHQVYPTLKGRKKIPDYTYITEIESIFFNVK